MIKCKDTRIKIHDSSFLYNLIIKTITNNQSHDSVLYQTVRPAALFSCTGGPYEIIHIVIHSFDTI